MVTYLGSLVRLCCGEGRTLQTNIAGLCGECSQWMDHTGFAPAHGMCACLGLYSQAPGCSAGALSKVGPATQVLGYSARTQTQLGVRFVPFPGPSSSGNQVSGKCTVPGGPCILITSPFPAARSVSQVHCKSTISGVPCVSSGELISACDPPDACQPSRIPRSLG